MQNVLVRFEEPTKLPELYAAVAEAVPEALNREHWQAKVRQVLYTHPDVFKRSERGVWGLA